MKHTDKFGRAKRQGRNRILEHANVRGRKKGNSQPLPPHMMVHPQRARPTYAPHGPITRSWPLLEALPYPHLLHRLHKSGKVREYQMRSYSMGRLGHTDDYGLMITLCRRADGDVYYC